jgi:hypothetical protein
MQAEDLPMYHESRGGGQQPKHQIRRLVVYVHPVVLSAVGAAQVRSRIQLGRLSAVWWWLVDCHRD